MCRESPVHVALIEKPTRDRDFGQGHPGSRQQALGVRELPPLDQIADGTSEAGSNSPRQRHGVNLQLSRQSFKPIRRGLRIFEPLIEARKPGSGLVAWNVASSERKQVRDKRFDVSRLFLKNRMAQSQSRPGPVRVAAGECRR